MNMSKKGLKRVKSRLGVEEISAVPSEITHSPRTLKIFIELEGECPIGDWIISVIILKEVILETQWREPTTLFAVWERDAGTPEVIASLADEPLVILLRLPSVGKAQTEADPYKDADKAAAATLDLLPILLGENSVSRTINLVYVASGDKLDCAVRVKVESSVPYPFQTAVRVTLLRAACLPIGKSETMYIAGVNIAKLELPFPKITFGPSFPAGPEKPMWASLTPLRYAAISDYSKIEDDVCVDDGLKHTDHLNCNVTEWNLCRRILVDNEALKTGLSVPIIMEVAGLSKSTKPETCGHYMTILDLKVLLEPSEYCVTVRAPLWKYEATLLPDVTPPMLDIPSPNLYNAPVAIIPVAFENILDENEHKAYVEINFDISSPLIPAPSHCELYKTIGKDETKVAEIIDEFIPAPRKPKPPLDVHAFKSECGALILHTELEAAMIKVQITVNRRKSALAAHKILKLTKKLLMEFHPDNCTTLNRYDTINRQHAAARRAVMSSFEPQPHPTAAPLLSTAARARYAGNIRLADGALANTLKAESTNPRPLITVALRHLEKFNDAEAIETLALALDKQVNNRFMLWFLGALESERGVEGETTAIAALRLTICSDNAEGTRRVIGWAALHAHNHRCGQMNGAFVAARNMRKASELPSNWLALVARWKQFSGEEEHQWDPATVSPKNPLVMAAAMFLCLRVYNFAERLLTCSDYGCGILGTRRTRDEFSRCADVKYMRASIALLQGSLGPALLRVDQAISAYAPSCQRARLRLSCLATREHWDEECEAALEETERFGAPSDPAHLLRSAVYSRNPNVGLQRAARAHKMAPSAQTAIVMARLKSKLGRERSAERWAAAAVTAEPEEADGWAELARQQLMRQQPREARAALRTARQAGPISAYLLEEIKAISRDVRYAGLPEFMAESLCLCDI